MKYLQDQMEQVLPINTKVDIPLYMAIALFQREIVDISHPKYLTKEYFNTLKAGSEVVTMRTQSAYIYENVNRICEYLEDTLYV